MPRPTPTAHFACFPAVLVHCIPDTVHSIPRENTRTAPPALVVIASD